MHCKFPWYLITWAPADRRLGREIQPHFYPCAASEFTGRAGQEKALRSCGSLALPSRGRYPWGFVEPTGAVSAPDHGVSSPVVPACDKITGGDKAMLDQGFPQVQSWEPPSPTQYTRSSRWRYSS